MDSAELAGKLAACGIAGRYWIGYSGGLDSHVLLHQCARLGLADACSEPGRRGRFRFAAVHVHHGLQPSAEAWAEHCAEACRGLGVPFRLMRVDARPQPGQSPEEAARNARYRAFEELLEPGDALLTAQHADDQAETVLLQLLRGAGLAGLAAMPEAMPLGRGTLLRPLLSRSREALQGYAMAHGLHWVEDPSNRDTTYDRNFIRRQVMPLLAGRWPGVAATLGRTARHCAEAQGQLQRLADDLLLAAGAGEPPDTLSVACLRQWQAPEQRLVLRHWLKNRGFRAPSAAVLQRIVAEALTAAEHRNPRVAWREGEVRRYRERLYALRPLPPLDRQAVYAWDGRRPLALPGNGVLELCAGEGVRPVPWNGAMQVRYRQGGERCRLPGRQGSHALKKLFQETDLAPPWVRERMPLLYIDGRLAAVGDLWVCEPFAGAGSGVTLRWSGHGLSYGGHS